MPQNGQCFCQRYDPTPVGTCLGTPFGRGRWRAMTCSAVFQAAAPFIMLVHTQRIQNVSHQRHGQAGHQPGAMQLRQRTTLHPEHAACHHARELQ